MTAYHIPLSSSDSQLIEQFKSCAPFDVEVCRSVDSGFDQTMRLLELTFERDHLKDSLKWIKKTSYVDDRLYHLLEHLLRFALEYDGQVNASVTYEKLESPVDISSSWWTSQQRTVRDDLAIDYYDSLDDAVTHVVESKRLGPHSAQTPVSFLTKTHRIASWHFPLEKIERHQKSIPRRLRQAVMLMAL